MIIYQNVMWLHAINLPCCSILFRQLISENGIDHFESLIASFRSHPTMAISRLYNMSNINTQSSKREWETFHLTHFPFYSLSASVNINHCVVGSLSSCCCCLLFSVLISTYMFSPIYTISPSSSWRGKRGNDKAENSRGKLLGRFFLLIPIHCRRRLLSYHKNIHWR